MLLIKIKKKFPYSKRDELFNTQNIIITSSEIFSFFKFLSPKSPQNLQKSKANSPPRD